MCTAVFDMNVMAPNSTMQHIRCLLNALSKVTGSICYATQLGLIKNLILPFRMSWNVANLQFLVQMCVPQCANKQSDFKTI